MGEQPPAPRQPRPPKAPPPKRNPIAEHAPWRPAAYGIEEAGAIQALVRGDAKPHQQQLAVNWVINQAAATYDAHYYPSERDTAFALGKAHVGQQIVKLLKTNLNLFKRR